MSESSPSAQLTNLSEAEFRQLEAQLREMKSQLTCRDRTVQELTERLAQTVEKLDRVQRVGSDRKVSSTSSFPKEVVQQQTELVEDLQRAVQMWENMQLACGLGRLEMQLSDLHALFEEHFREPKLELDLPEEVPIENAEPCNEPEMPSPPEAEISVGRPNLEEEISEDPALSIDDVCPLRPPEILNLAEADIEALSRCVDQQDAYIDYLSARLQRTAEKTIAIDWEGLAQLPERLKGQLEFTATKIQQGRHFAEFELALQRTRLKRKERELKKLSEELNLQMQSGGDSTEKASSKDPGGRRWMRMLGMGKADSE